ncbi:hypothetical protein pipiens_018713 [Culex pipiens pipiens]|uniref:p53 DNA-binding domain-containing protein n=1 Tax=Culex pipiens pipiens TaxID=38569 RepID=A0ABD1E0B0_CULPP
MLPIDSLELSQRPICIFMITPTAIGKNETSNKLNRIFTSTGKSLTFNMAMNPHTPLLVRIMLVCSNQLFQPLSRCSYHIRGDNTTFRDHVVTHRDSAAIYVGTANGIYQRERLAILVPIEEIGREEHLPGVEVSRACLVLQNQEDSDGTGVYTL